VQRPPGDEAREAELKVMLDQFEREHPGSAAAKRAAGARGDDARVSAESGGVTIRDDASVRRLVLVALVVGGVCVSACGGGTRHKYFPAEPEHLAPPSEAQRLEQACDEAGQELLKIDQHEVPSLPRGKVIEKDADESLRVDWETAEQIRLLISHDAQTQQVLADLARGQAEIRAIVRKLRRPGTIKRDSPCSS
jgi:hypothetical protein